MTLIDNIVIIYHDHNYNEKVFIRMIKELNKKKEPTCNKN